MKEIIKIDELTRTEKSVEVKKELFECGEYQIIHEVHSNPIWEHDIEFFNIFRKKMFSIEYLPEIYFYDLETMFSKDATPYFKIATTSYGSMTTDEVKKMIASYQEAVEVVEALTDKFIERR